jgi:hypothetical protein
MFQRTILLESNSPFGDRSNFIHSCMFKWTARFKIGISGLIKEISHFPELAVVIFIHVWLVHIVTKI